MAQTNNSIVYFSFEKVEKILSLLHTKIFENVKKVCLYTNMFLNVRNDYAYPGKWFQNSEKYGAAALLR